MPSNHPKITLLVTPDQDSWLNAQTGPLKTKSIVIRDLIDTARQACSGGVDYAPTVSVRDTPTERETIQFVQEETTQAVVSSLENFEKVSLPESRGVVVGMGEPERETPKRGGVWKKEVPPALECHSELIFAFWGTKAGAKSKQAWALLMTELGKIQDQYDDRALRDQLELAAANRWKSVTLKNYEQFGVNTPRQAYGKPETDWAAIEAALPKMPW